MARNGTGTYALPNTVNPVVTDTTITSTWANTTLDDIATELTNSLPRDGQAAPTANLPMGGYKLTGLGNGSASTDSVNYGQVFSSPAFTGTPTAPTAAVGTNTTQIATCAHVFATAMTAALPGISGAVADYFTTNNGTVGSWSNLLKATAIRFADGADTTKRLAFDVSGVTTGQTRTVTLPDYSGTLGLMAKGVDIASAATINLDTATGDFVHVTGTTTITAITLASGAERTVVFDGALTLTHNATTLILPGGANITTAAGDRATFRGDGTGNVRCIHYTKASGQAIVGATAATQAEMEAASSSTAYVTAGNANWHPGSAKAWLKCNTSGTINASHNITSITDVGVGEVSVTIATDFSSANYSVTFALAHRAGDVGYVMAGIEIRDQLAGSFSARAFKTDGTQGDPSTGWFFACFGDQ